MTINEFVKQHNLSGSLLESISVNDSEKSLCLEIDYCYWKQANYHEGDEETAILLFSFENCSSYSFDDHTINSDEIVKAEIVDDGLDICVESDLTGDYHHIIINAQNITVIRNERT
jgi:hypothetical protein